jgi:hypothetical protein
MWCDMEKLLKNWIERRVAHNKVGPATFSIKFANVCTRLNSTRRDSKMPGDWFNRGSNTGRGKLWTNLDDAEFLQETIIRPWVVQRHRYASVWSDKFRVIHHNRTGVVESCPPDFSHKSILPTDIHQPFSWHTPSFWKDFFHRRWRKIEHVRPKQRHIYTSLISAV